MACFEHRLKATLRNKQRHENISKSKISLWSVEFQTSPAKDFVEELQGVHQYALIFTPVFGIINNLLEWKSYYSVFSLGEENYVEKCGFHLHKWKNKQKANKKPQHNQHLSGILKVLLSHKIWSRNLQTIHLLIASSIFDRCSICNNDLLLWLIQPNQQLSAEFKGYFREFCQHLCHWI